MLRDLHPSPGAVSPGLTVGLFLWLACLTAHGKPIIEAVRQHWTFHPLDKVHPPSLRNLKSATRTPVDLFIGPPLVANGVATAQPASKEQFMRRVTFGLIGLPPG